MRFSASVSLMFQEHPLLDRFAAARDAGFEGVELQRLDEGDPVLMARAARRAGVDVVLLNVPAADYLEGGPGLSGVPGREREFDTALGTALAAADALGSYTWPRRGCRTASRGRSAWPLIAATWDSPSSEPAARGRPC